MQAEKWYLRAVKKKWLTYPQFPDIIHIRCRRFFAVLSSQLRCLQTDAVEYDSERSYDDVPYLSAQEAPAQERAWLPQENGDRERPQGAVPPQSEGQKKAELLSAGHS